jgi:hypothetical protein
MLPLGRRRPDIARRVVDSVTARRAQIHEIPQILRREFEFRLGRRDCGERGLVVGT